VVKTWRDQKGDPVWGGEDLARPEGWSGLGRWRPGATRRVIRSGEVKTGFEPIRDPAVWG